MIETMIENLISHSQSSHDDNILDQIMSLCGLKWRFVIVAILLTLKRYIRMIKCTMKEFQTKDLGKRKFCFNLEIKHF